MKENIGEYGVIKGLKPPFISMKQKGVSDRELFDKALQQTIEYYQKRGLMKG